MKVSEKAKTALKRLWHLLINPRFLVCFGLAWLLTNGWAYLLLVLGSSLHIGWMVALAGAYLTFLWFPFTPEKVITMALAILLLRLLFPKDQKTMSVLRELRVKAKRKNIKKST